MKGSINMNRSIFPFLLFAFALIILPLQAQAQKKERTRLKVYYEKLADADKKISLILTQGSGKKIAGINNAAIHLSTLDLDEEIKLATLNTDENGEAFLYVEADYKFPRNEDGYSVIKATFPGNDSLRSAKKSVEFIDLDIDIHFEVVDSVKLLTISTWQLDSIGEKEPVKEIDLNVGVERLYSTLFLEKIETDEEGKASLEFPNDIPGDSIGTINVVVFVDDHDDYGTITKSAEIDWGMRVDYSDKSIGRSLFSDEAPVWMIISVFIILAGAWYHFGLAILKLVKMRKLSHN